MLVALAGRHGEEPLNEDAIFHLNVVGVCRANCLNECAPTTVGHDDFIRYHFCCTTRAGAAGERLEEL
eukprot:7863721-Alexandrium_andersonii.AAC.1